METNCIIQGDALSVLRTLPSESVDCVLTSPPYWGLRDYGTEAETIWDGEASCSHQWKVARILGHSDRGKGKQKAVFDDSFQTKGTHSVFCQKCGAWKGQLGLEPTSDLYLKHLGDIFEQVKRVLKKTGTCWVNLGDTYAGSNNGSNDYREKDGLGLNPAKRYKGQKAGRTGLPAKCLCLIPFRFAIQMVDRGWILRNIIIWHKPNCMPASVKDRCSTDFEHLFFFTRSKRYWFEQQFEPLAPSSDVAYRAALRSNKAYAAKRPYRTNFPRSFHLNGRNKRCVWTIPTSPFREAHFATFPEALCETPIRAGCPELICAKCGQARQKIASGKSAGSPFNIRVRDAQEGGLKHTDRRASNAKVGGEDERGYDGSGRPWIDYSDCGCHAGWRPGVVLDPFFGSGTTGVTALKHNRQFIGIEPNARYVEIAARRLAPLLKREPIVEFPTCAPNLFTKAA